MNLSVGTVNTIIHEHFKTGCASIIHNQAFHVLNVHRNDCCGLGTTMAGIVTDGRTAIFETFTSFICLTAAECLITVLCLKSSVDIRAFYAFVYKKLYHHTLSHARTNTVACHLDLQFLDWPTTCAPPVSN
jgi:hypothetical protein